MSISIAKSVREGEAVINHNLLTSSDAEVLGNRPRVMLPASGTC